MMLYERTFWLVICIGRLRLILHNIQIERENFLFMAHLRSCFVSCVPRSGDGQQTAKQIDLASPTVNFVPYASLHVEIHEPFENFTCGIWHRYSLLVPCQTLLAWGTSIAKAKLTIQCVVHSWIASWNGCPLKRTRGQPNLPCKWSVWCKMWSCSKHCSVGQMLISLHSCQDFSTDVSCWMKLHIHLLWVATGWQQEMLGFMKTNGVLIDHQHVMKSAPNSEPLRILSGLFYGGANKRVSKMAIELN